MNIYVFMHTTTDAFFMRQQQPQQQKQQQSTKIGKSCVSSVTRHLRPIGESHPHPHSQLTINNSQFTARNSKSIHDKAREPFDIPIDTARGREGWIRLSSSSSCATFDPDIVFNFVAKFNGEHREHKYAHILKTRERKVKQL